MNARMAEALPAAIADEITVDTPERWQGLERPIMVVVHPVSGVTEPTAFDLETGRLCVMASRHQVGLIIVTRDHLPSTLEDLTPERRAARRPARCRGPGPGAPRGVLGTVVCPRPSNTAQVVATRTTR